MCASKHENVRRNRIRTIRVFQVLAGDRSSRSAGFLTAGRTTIRCALGENGATRRKREGDRATPIGAVRILEWRMRPVQPAYARHGLNWRSVRTDEGWCDDPGSGAYNRQVRLPFLASHEVMFRLDGKYDVVGILDYNYPNIRRGLGSAIFFHICDDQYGATAGCIAIPAREFRKLLPRLARKVRIEISTGSRRSRNPRELRLSPSGSLPRNRRSFPSTSS